MIKVTLYSKNNEVWRIKFKGHAGFAAHGEDIVCASVSLLVFNTINSIEKFTDEPIKELAVNEDKGILDIEFPRRKTGEYGEESGLLLKSMIFGLMTIEEMYGEKYIQINNLTGGE